MGLARAVFKFTDDPTPPDDGFGAVPLDVICILAPAW